MQRKRCEKWMVNMCAEITFVWSWLDKVLVEVVGVAIEIDRHLGGVMAEIVVAVTMTVEGTIAMIVGMTDTVIEVETIVMTVVVMMTVEEIVSQIEGEMDTVAKIDIMMDMSSEDPCEGHHHRYHNEDEVLLLVADRQDGDRSRPSMSPTIP